MNIRRCYDLFLTDRKISGCSESTLRFYEYVIGKLFHYLTSTDSDSSVEDLQTYILPFFSHLQQQDLSPSTYHSLFRGIRAFTRFLHQEEYVEKRDSITQSQTASYHYIPSYTKTNEEGLTFIQLQ